MEAKSYCHFQITLLKQTGIWPADRKSPALHLLQKLMLYIQLVTLLVISLALILGAFFSNDLKNISSSVDMVTLTISAMYKAWFVTSHIQDFQHLIAFMGRKFKDVVCNKNGDVISVKNESRYSSLYTYLLCFSGAAVMLLYSIVPILENKDHFRTTTSNSSSNSTEELFRKIRFPLMTWIPFNVYWSPLYEFLYVMHGFSLFSSANIYLVNDSFFFMTIYQVCIQMRMLSEMLMNIENGRMDYMDDSSQHLLMTAKNQYTTQKTFSRNKQDKKMAKQLHNGDDSLLIDLNESLGKEKTKAKILEQQMIQMKLKKCIAFHSDLLRVIMTIEKLFRSMILADVLHAIISLSFALHETGVSDSIYERVKMYMFLLVCIIHQLGNSYYGQMLLNAQEMISSAAYNLKWYNANIQTKKYLILILARSQKFTVLSGGKMYYLRFQSFILFMKTIFSYYMVLRQASSE